MGRSWVRFPAAALSGNNLGHTNVPLFTKQYNLVPCEGFHVNAPVCGSHWQGPNEQGEYNRHTRYLATVPDSYRRQNILTQTGRDDVQQPIDSWLGLSRASSLVSGGR